MVSVIVSIKAASIELLEISQLSPAEPLPCIVGKSRQSKQKEVVAVSVWFN